MTGLKGRMLVSIHSFHGKRFFCNMDSVTHLVLGAAIGEVTLGRKIGYRAAIIGAIADTVPDLDVFGSFFTHDEMTKLLIHRSYTHSAFIGVLLALPLAWITYVIFKRRIPYSRWYLLWWLGLFSHVMLDSCTTYGTQLFLPFTHVLVGFNNINVLDLVFTIPFLILVIVSLCYRKENPLSRRFAWAGLTYALLYIGGSFINKYNIHHHFESELKRQNIPAQSLYTTPGFMSNFLWGGIAMNNDSLWLGEYSVFQKNDEVQWAGYPRNTQLVENHPDKRSTGIITWFSQGKSFALQNGDTLKIYNAKWGRGDFRYTAPDDALPFHYEIYPNGNGWKTDFVRRNFTSQDFKTGIGALWKRALGTYK